MERKAKPTGTGADMDACWSMLGLSLVSLPRSNGWRCPMLASVTRTASRGPRCGMLRLPTGASPMRDTPTHTQLAEAREHGIPEGRIVEMLADIVKGLREGLS
jgi:hypothetical protein